MEVKEAVKTALGYVSDAFSDEKLSNLGLEEVIYDESHGRWKITVGFSRPWDYPRHSIAATMANPSLLLERAASRTYKVVEIRDSNGEVTAIRNKDVEVDE